MQGKQFKSGMRSLWARNFQLTSTLTSPRDLNTDPVTLDDPCGWDRKCHQPIFYNTTCISTSSCTFTNIDPRRLLKQCGIPGRTNKRNDVTEIKLTRKSHLKPLTILISQTSLISYACTS